MNNNQNNQRSNNYGNIQRPNVIRPPVQRPQQTQNTADRPDYARQRPTQTSKMQAQSRQMQRNIPIQNRTSSPKYRSTSSKLNDLKMKRLWLIGGIFLCVLIILVIIINLFSAFAKIGKLNKSEKETGESTRYASQTDEAESGSDTSTVSDAPVTDAPSDPEPVKPTYELNFKTDLSEYEQYMNPSDNSQYLILVNTSNLLDSTFAPTDLVDVVDTRNDRSARQMREYAEKSLEAFMKELRANGYADVSVTSAYRSYSEQTSLFNGYISNYTANHPSASYEEAYAYVATFSAPPGTSEHQTGLCVDMHNLSGADVSFANQPAAVWMAENCWKFGFILRYPEDKTDITGYSFEPWHFRFVGRDAAKVIHDGGLCLEEYIATIG